MHVNYEFVIDKCLEYESTGKILDYGCGGGDVVMEGRSRGLDIVGVEAFYGGSSAKEIVAFRGLLDVSVFPLDEEFRIPFSDNSFDMVVSNQVMEHVEDLAHTFAEINRVLKPNGRFLALFPDRGVIREGHCGIPLAHWFSNQSKWRYPYMRAMRQLGFGYHKNNKSSRQWTLDFMDWLDKYTYYRSYAEIYSCFTSNEFSIVEMEHDYMNYRLRKIGIDIPSRVKEHKAWRGFVKHLCRKLGGMVILATKDSVA